MSARPKTNEEENPTVSANLENKQGTKNPWWQWNQPENQ
jgi:hypothetical protein